MAAAKIAILGAGLAGISAARALIARGHAVTIFDKGRGPGGRLATRRMEAAGRKLQFDHGAQYLRAEGAGFAAALVEAKAAPWPDATRRVGMPSMSAVPRALSLRRSVWKRRRRASASKPRSTTVRRLGAPLSSRVATVGVCKGLRRSGTALASSRKASCRLAAKSSAKAGRGGFMPAPGRPTPHHYPRPLQRGHQCSHRWHSQCALLHPKGMARPRALPTGNNASDAPPP